MKKHFKFILSTVLLVALSVVLSISWKGAPPVGKLLDPVAGIYSGGQGSAAFTEVSIDGLKDKVSISYDERGVPHVFAKNDHDLYCAQGFAEAADRYWQMEFMARTAAGRLSEVLGADYLAFDREIRRQGILKGAEESLQLIKKDQVTYQALLAYTKGVNAYVASLDVTTLPLEYKLLNYEPEEWTPLHSVLVMKLTGQNLSGYEKDVELTTLYNALGAEDFKHLFPGVDFEAEGIATLDNPSLAKAEETNRPEWATSYAGLGSNAWAISPEKSASGNTVLSMDPHLNLSYPSFWFEIQLKSHKQNVYGASIPGVPGVIMGFNEHISFCTTNGQADVKDWYLLEMDAAQSSYMLDGKKVSFETRTEKFKIKGGGEFTDIIKVALQGPVVFEGDFNADVKHVNMALSWELQKPSNDIRTFLLLNRAQNKEDFKEAVKGYSCPSQNFIYGDNKGQIAQMHQGRLRTNRVGNGRFVLDGSKSKYFEFDYIPQHALPNTVNPESGFVYSTNQKPEDTVGEGISYGYYSNVRHRRLEELLGASDALSIDDMKKFQLDNLNVFARESLPLFLKILNSSDVQGGKNEMELLKKWDYHFDADQKAPLVFDILWKKVQENMYSKFPNYEVLPDQYRSLELLTAYDTAGMDAHSWSQFNTLDALFKASYKETLDSLKNLKADYGNKVTWGSANPIAIGHMTNLAVFGDYHYESNGHRNVLNAVHGNWGPSWRMIIEMGEEMTAYAVYPGGQQGDPRNKNYNAFTNTWYDGKYYKTILYKTLKEASQKSKRTITIYGKN